MNGDKEISGSAEVVLDVSLGSFRSEVVVGSDSAVEAVIVVLVLVVADVIVVSS